LCDEIIVSIFFHYCKDRQTEKKKSTTPTNKNNTQTRNNTQQTNKKKKTTKKNLLFLSHTHARLHTQQEQQQLALRFAFCRAKTTKSTNDDEKTEENTF
jgi:hypothetical protein